MANLGHPVLRRVAVPVDREELQTRALQGFLDDLVRSMLYHDGVGLAAPQVFRSQRVVAIGIPLNTNEAELGIAGTVLVNPELFPEGEELEEDWEGCLSLKDLRGRVPRHCAVVLKAWDRNGNTIESRLEGYPARVVQHELDHLDGIVFLDRMTELASLGFSKEVARFHLSAPPEED